MYIYIYIYIYILYISLVSSDSTQREEYEKADKGGKYVPGIYLYIYIYIYNLEEEKAKKEPPSDIHTIADEDIKLEIPKEGEEQKYSPPAATQEGAVSEFSEEEELPANKSWGRIDIDAKYGKGQTKSNL